MKPIYFIFPTLLSLFSSGCSMFGIRTVEEAPYTITMREGDKEIRKYPPRLIAQTTASGDYKEAQRTAFRRLADYIFGKNRDRKKIAMTAPVTREEQSTEIAMTAPVTQQAADQGWQMTFSMPREYATVDDLPQPLDKDVVLSQIPEKTFAAITFTWLTDEEKNQKKAQELITWLESTEKYQMLSTPIYAGYDPPWTLPFFRRQEMMIEIEPRADSCQEPKP